MYETCDGCVYHALPECKRFPPSRHGYPMAVRGCGEYKAKEVVIPCPVVEEKAEEAKAEVRAEEKVESNQPLGVPPIPYRGWTKGKPRK